MITDVLTNSDQYLNLNKNFKLVFDYIKENKMKDMSCGSYEIKGKEVFVNINEYETKQIQKLEAHKKYIDIQVVLTGEEYMGYTNIENTEVSEEYNEEKDVEFLTGSVDKIKATTQNFLIFYPQDAHMPALCTDTPKYTKKAIFKILAE